MQNSSCVVQNGFKNPRGIRERLKPPLGLSARVFFGEITTTKKKLSKCIFCAALKVQKTSTNKCSFVCDVNQLCCEKGFKNPRGIRERLKPQMGLCARVFYGEIISRKKSLVK